MPARPRVDILVIDRSTLAQNMYQLLFAGQRKFRVRFGEEFESLFKKSVRLRPDLLIINGNALPPQEDLLKFPCPTILIASKGRLDLREAVDGKKDLVLIEKPFYPYDLLSVANRLTQGGAFQRVRRPGRPPLRRAKAVNRRKKR